MQLICVHCVVRCPKSTAVNAILRKEMTFARRTSSNPSTTLRLWTGEHGTLQWRAVAVKGIGLSALSDRDVNCGIEHFLWEIQILTSQQQDITILPPCLHIGSLERRGQRMAIEYGVGRPQICPRQVAVTRKQMYAQHPAKVKVTCSAQSTWDGSQESQFCRIAKATVESEKLKRQEKRSAKVALDVT